MPAPGLRGGSKKPQIPMLPNQCWDWYGFLENRFSNCPAGRFMGLAAKPLLDHTAGSIALL
jgi:hypothetical protein